MGDYEDALADLQTADRATRNHENTLRYEPSFTFYEFFSYVWIDDKYGLLVIMYNENVGSITG